jgi:hypothetical protein
VGKAHEPGAARRGPTLLIHLQTTLCMSCVSLAPPTHRTVRCFISWWSNQMDRVSIG